MTKNLCDKVSQIKKLRWQFRRIFRWLRRGVLHFFCRPCFHGEICKTKWTLFILFRVASILFCKFLHENKVYRKNGVHHDEASGKSFQTVISDFIFLKLCHRDFSPQSNVKNHDFIKKLVQFSIFSGHPLVYLISLTYSQNMGLDYAHLFLSKFSFF